MKNLKKFKPLGIVLLLLNICAFSCILILFFAINQYKVLTFGASKNDYVLPALSSKIEKINVGSRAFIVYDAKSRSILIGKNERLRFAPASTAKIMTATIALAHYDQDMVLTAKKINTVQGSKMNLDEGEEMTVKNLLYGMLLPSGNDAAYVLASSFPGGEDTFVKEMNKKASELQLDNTHFVDPAGYDDDNYTTAFDLARLAAYAMENPNFAKIVSTPHIVVTDATGRNIHDLNNLNELLGTDHITGIKTGFTDEAGGVLVTSVDVDKRRYIIVVLNSQDRFQDTLNIVNSAISEIRLLFY